jgi:hypothetical protein
MSWMSQGTVPVVGLTALAALVGFQIVSAWRLVKQLRVAAEMAARLDRLTAALGLLTDTTEGGLSALTAEIERLGRRAVVPVSRDGRRSTAGGSTRRDEFSQAALDAALSESEAHAHLGLLTPSAGGDRHASLLA